MSLMQVMMGTLLTEIAIISHVKYVHGNLQEISLVFLDTFSENKPHDFISRNNNGDFVSTWTHKIKSKGSFLMNLHL